METNIKGFKKKIKKLLTYIDIRWLSLSDFFEIIFENYDVLIKFFEIFIKPLKPNVQKD